MLPKQTREVNKTCGNHNFGETANSRKANCSRENEHKVAIKMLLLAKPTELAKPMVSHQTIILTRHANLAKLAKIFTTPTSLARDKQVLKASSRDSPASR